jgi:hypothetical protein
LAQQVHLTIGINVLDRDDRIACIIYTYANQKHQRIPWDL